MSPIIKKGEIESAFAPYVDFGVLMTSKLGINEILMRYIASLVPWKFQRVDKAEMVSLNSWSCKDGWTQSALQGFYILFWAYDPPHYKEGCKLS